MARNTLCFACLLAIIINCGSSGVPASVYKQSRATELYGRVDPNTPELIRIRQNPGRPHSAKLARQFGYAVKTYGIETADGYILTMIRIQRKGSYMNSTANSKTSRPAVLLLPVLKTSSAIWLGLGPGKAYALKLVEAGFDVWLGDFRGAPSSQRHSRLNPGRAEYWSFTVNEHGRYDVKAFVDKVLRETKQEKILVSTYCMGTPALLVYCHYHEGDCKNKIRGAVMMGSFLDLKSLKKSSFKSVLQLLTKPKDPLFDRMDRMGYVRFSPEKLETLPVTVSEKLFIYNQQPPSLETLTAHDIEFGTSRPNVIARIWPEFVLPAPLEIYRFFTKTWKTGVFGGLDYGKEENLKRYGTAKPVVYDLKKTSMPVLLIYSEDDPVGTPEETRKIASGIANPPTVIGITDFTHFEFIFSDTAAEKVYVPAIRWFKTALRRGKRFTGYVQRATKFMRASTVHPPLAINLAKEFGYAAKTYHIVTSDGYITTMVRLGPKGNETEDENENKDSNAQKRPAILLVSGIRSASGVWLALGPDKSYALKLVEAGFDVWLGNFRGTGPSQDHVVLDSNSTGYWRFTPHEHALDLAAFIDSIRRLTKQNKILFSGHSTASLPLFIYCHLDPIGCKRKLKLAALIAPVLDLSSISENNFLTNVFLTIMTNLDLMEGLGYVQFPPESSDGLPAQLNRRIQLTFAPKPSNGTRTLLGIGPQIRDEVVSRVWSELVSRKSLQAYLFLLNTWKTGVFQGLDWGPKENLKRYQQKRPPVYDLKRTSVPIYVTYSDGDAIATHEESEKIQKRLPNIVNFSMEQNLNHWDFIFSDEAPPVYDKMINWMLNAIQQKNQVQDVKSEDPRSMGLNQLGPSYIREPAIASTHKAIISFLQTLQPRNARSALPSAGLRRHY